MFFRISFVVLLSISHPIVAGEVRYIGQVAIPADATDLSNETGELEGGIPANRLGGHGSGITWLGRGSRYAMIPDRGPADGASSYRCRFHIVDIRVDETANSKQPVTFQLVETHLLTNRMGKPLVGSLGALPEADDSRGVRFDPESIRVTPKGTFLISDEYGPVISEFTAKGRQIDDIPIPSRYQITKGAATPEGELPPNNLSGRMPNRGFECMALSPDGFTIYTMAQSALIQDGAMDAEGKKVGTNLRLLEIRRGSGVTREFLYQMDDPVYGCSEIEFLAPGRFLVIERDGKPGADSTAKKIYEVDMRQATDIKRIESLPATGTPKDVKPLVKRLFLNLLDPAWNLAPADIPEKIEGLAIGPKLSDGSQLLLVSTDNDFLSNQPSRIYAFAFRID